MPLRLSPRGLRLVSAAVLRKRLSDLPRPRRLHRPEVLTHLTPGKAAPGSQVLREAMAWSPPCSEPDSRLQGGGGRGLVPRSPGAPGLTPLPSCVPVALLCPFLVGPGPPRWGRMSGFCSRTLGVASEGHRQRVMRCSGPDARPLEPPHQGRPGRSEGSLPPWGLWLWNPRGPPPCGSPGLSPRLGTLRLGPPGLWSFGEDVPRRCQEQAGHRASRFASVWAGGQ